jgi:NAD(P)-dependent dehydrogenase (short-subunit alcohol dehydrogenase family)
MADPSTIDQWKAYVDVNLTGNFSLAQAVIPHMRVCSPEDKRKLPNSNVGGVGPCIVFVSSFRGVVSDSNQEGYAATKAGLIGLTSAMAVSMQEFGIRVNCVSPGRIKATHENKEADENGGEWGIEGDDVAAHVTNR